MEIRELNLENNSFKFFKDKQAFLKLLVSQLKNQDPSAPMKADDFTKQLISFGSIEQTMVTNERLASMLNSIEKMSGQMILNNLGRKVEVSTDKSYFDGENAATWWYSVPEESSVNWRIKDASGAVVAQGRESVSTGKNKVSWGGDEEGVYSIEMFDESGNRIETRARAILEGVNLKDGVMDTILGQFGQNSLLGITN